MLVLGPDANLPFPLFAATVHASSFERGDERWVDVLVENHIGLELHAWGARVDDFTPRISGGTGGWVSLPPLPSISR